MSIHELAGKPAPQKMLIDVTELESAYYDRKPDPDNPAQQVSFGTSGHRGTSLEGSFNEDHVLAISQAICEYRQAEKINGPLYVGMDTHALSSAAHETAVEVFAANGLDTFIQAGGGYTPTPVISHAILTYNHNRSYGLADGVVITPSHNPPEDGGFKYNPPTGGPAGTEITRRIQDRANEILKNGLNAVQRMPYENAILKDHVHEYDYLQYYVGGLRKVVDLGAVSRAGLRIGVDPMGGAAVKYWDPIADTYGLNIEVVNRDVDPRFSFMTLDHDGKIRMDCSSPFAMARLIELKDRFDIAFGNDPDVDRHGIVTPSAGLMNPNHFLAVAIWYLFRNRSEWPEDAAVGKTLVSSSMIDRVAEALGRRLAEVPVGFKWFVDGLILGNYGFGGEESAGASFLRMDGSVWTTDKDGIILDLLAAEITAATGKDPGEHYQDLVERFGNPVYARIDAPANRDQKDALKNLTPDRIERDTLAGDPILAKLNRAPANNEPIGGIKVVTKNGWFAARPSGTEDIYKIYAESFKGESHLEAIQTEAQEIVGQAFEKSGI